MVEVFRTNIENSEQEEFILYQLSQFLPDYRINFDLEDCDNILRVESNKGSIEIWQIIFIMKRLGFTAEVLEDKLQCVKESKTLLQIYWMP